MEIEKILSEFASETKFEDIPSEIVDLQKDIILTIIGTTISGANSEGCKAIIKQIKNWGGRKEATILVHGGMVPAHNAAFVNSIMARALDFCDAMMPGMHVGSSSVPTALAMAELVGGINGKEFLAALIIGTELSARINSISVYNGFDPTGICSIFATTTIAGRLLNLDSLQMLNALALAFNRSGGSFQSNIDGSLAVRVIQGFVSQSGIICAQLAKRGITGPKNFMEGIYGYFHLYAKDKYNKEALIENLGKRFEMDNTLFKKYPSCGCTLSSTDAILDLIKEKEIIPEEIDHIEVKVPPYCYKLVGHPFEIGSNPKVNAQFSIQYCVANALIRRSSKLSHFDEFNIKDPKIQQMIKKIQISADQSLEHPENPGFSLSAHMTVYMTNGKVYEKTVTIPRGLPGNPLTKEEHLERFYDCIDYSGKKLHKKSLNRIILIVKKLEEIKDVRKLIPLLLF